MHFFVFMFLWIMMALSTGLFLFALKALYEDVINKRWHWMMGHLVAIPGIICAFLYFLDLFIKLLNA